MVEAAFLEIITTIFYIYLNIQRDEKLHTLTSSQFVNPNKQQNYRERYGTRTDAAIYGTVAAANETNAVAAIAVADDSAADKSRC